MDPVHTELLMKPLEPYPEDQMLPKGKEHREICQYLFEAYALTEDPEVRMKLRLAVTLAKRLHKKCLETLVRLGEYQWGQGK